MPAEVPVLRLSDGVDAAVEALLGRCGLELQRVPGGAAIPFSYWGETEAGIEGRRVYARADTPVHSVLHEAAHVLCMDGARRAQLARDAGGDFDEENAVCCLQVLLADLLPGVGAARLLADMDRWGYTFRLGSARDWYEREADEARAWLVRHGLVGADGRPTLRSRC
ncbi:MAG: hypothetical protein JSR73_00295 [Proteobacteria bacterium]|nr:hypothetical protein [Pseudomonadota bacterium]